MLIYLMTLAALGPDVTLQGIVLTRSGRHAAVLLQEGRSRPVMAGDRAFGCEVSAISGDHVDLICSGERRTLKLAGTRAKASGPEVAAAAPEASPPADLTLTRAEIQARLDSEMSRLMTETTLVPVTARGQVAGFTISRVPQGTILETLGIKAGDVLVSVNDTPIDSFTTLVGLWPRLQGSGSVRAQLIRDGRPVDISVSIR